MPPVEHIGSQEITMRHSSFFAFAFLTLAACADDTKTPSAGDPSTPGNTPPTGSVDEDPDGTTPSAPVAPGAVDPSCLNGGYAAQASEVLAVTATDTGVTVLSSSEVLAIDSAGKPGTTMKSSLGQFTDVRHLSGDNVLVVGGGLRTIDAMGKVVSTIAPSKFTYGVRAAAASKDGNIFIATTKKDASGFDQVVVQHVTSNGEIDPSFGEGGTSTTTVTEDKDLTVEGMAIADDGTIWVRGSGKLFVPFVARFSSTGALDTGAASDGVIGLPLGTRTSREIVFTKDGGAFILGMTSTSPQIAKVTAAGTLDASFGTNGVATLRITKPLSSEYDEDLESRALILTDDGSLLVVSSYEWDAEEDGKLEEETILVLRTTPAGVLDKSFGNAGVAKVALGGAGKFSKVWHRSSAALLGSKRLVIGGTTYSEIGQRGTRTGGLVCIGL
jgi:hypothetical protein